MLFLSIFSYLSLLMCSSGFGSWERFPAWPCWPLEIKITLPEGYLAFWKKQSTLGGARGAVLLPLRRRSCAGLGPMLPAGLISRDKPQGKIFLPVVPRSRTHRRVPSPDNQHPGAACVLAPLALYQSSGMGQPSPASLPAPARPSCSSSASS